MAKFIELTKVLDWKRLFEEVKQDSEEVIVKKGKEPIAVVMPYIDYENWLRTKEEAKKRFFKTIEKIWERNKDVDPKEVEEVVNEAVRAVRGELKNK